MDIDEVNEEELMREVKTQEESSDLINKKYKIIKKIGNGSFGNIYKGMNILTTQYDDYYKKLAEYNKAYDEKIKGFDAIISNN